MVSRSFLRRISFVMLMIAVLFIGYALHHPEGGTAFYIGSFYVGAAVWRKFYLVYVLIMIALLLGSYSKK